MEKYLMIAKNKFCIYMYGGELEVGVAEFYREMVF